MMVASEQPQTCHLFVTWNSQVPGWLTLNALRPWMETQLPWLRLGVHSASGRVMGDRHTSDCQKSGSREHSDTLVC